MSITKGREGIGFTGTRQINSQQEQELSGLLWALGRCGVFERVLRHGGCKGADVAAHDAAGSMRPPFEVEVYPGPRSRWDASELPKGWGSWYCKRHPRAPYLERNRAIIDASQICLAVVDGPERLRSGTWSTVRYARQFGLPRVILWPDVTVTLEVEHGWLEPILMACVKWAGLPLREVQGVNR